MKHPETYLVTKDNGPRPAGKPDECFYCHQPLGRNHKVDCVCRRRTVVIEARIRFVSVEPDAFTKADIEFRLNDSSSCGDNVLRYVELAFQSDTKRGICACDSITCEYIDEATREQEERYGVSSVFEE